MTKKLKTPKSIWGIPKVAIREMLTLATSGFSLVAALAWNEVVKEGVDTYIKPYLPKSSGFISLLIYAMLVTALAVTVSLQLTNIKRLLKKPKQ